MLDKRAALLSLTLVLAACGKSGQPEGQVVATVNGDEITTTDLDAELNGATAPTPAQQKMLQRAALDSIINRKIVAQAAAAEGLDKGPKAAVLEQKAKEMALIELYNQKMRTGIPAPSDEEVRSYIDGHPEQFAQHRVFVVDQLIVPQANAELAKALQPVKTLEQAQQVLAARKIPSNQTVGVIDSLTIPPEAAKQISAMPDRRGVHHSVERRHAHQSHTLKPGYADRQPAGAPNRARNSRAPADRGADAQRTREEDRARPRQSEVQCRVCAAKNPGWRRGRCGTARPGPVRPVREQPVQGIRATCELSRTGDERG